MKEASASVLTENDIRNAFKMMKKADEEDRKFKESRTLKDRSKLQPFYDVVKGEKMTDELFSFCQMVEHLAVGFILVLPNSLKSITDKELRDKWKLPQEILDNLLVSTYVNAVADESLDESSKP